MYSSKITLFNYYESATTGDAYWYPHVLSGVDLITDKGAILKKYGPDATDNAQLHVQYTIQNGDVTIADKDGKILPWVPPKSGKDRLTTLWKILSHSRTNHSFGRVSGLAERYPMVIIGMDSIST